jgi:hypothetical protein
MVWGTSTEKAYGGGIDDDDDDFEDIVKSQQDHIYFVVDCREEMMQLNANGESHLLNTFRTILHVMKSKIILRDRSSIGIILAGTGVVSQQHHYLEMLPLAVPSAENIRIIQSLVDDFDSEFMNRFGGSQPTDNKYICLKEALWKCSWGFSHKAPKGKSSSGVIAADKRIWIFTNDDNPNASNECIDDRKALLKVAEDSHRSGTEISLWCIDPSPSTPFNINAFYTDLLLSGGEEQDIDDDDYDVMVGIEHRIMRATSSGFDMRAPKARHHKKRPVFMGHIDLGLRRILPTDVISNNDTARSNDKDIALPGRIAVGFYAELRVATKPLSQKLIADTNEPVKSMTRFLDADTGERVHEEEIKTYVKTFNDNMPAIPMSREEMVGLRNVGESEVMVGRDIQYSKELCSMTKETAAQSSKPALSVVDSSTDATATANSSINLSDLNDSTGTHPTQPTQLSQVETLPTMPSMETGRVDSLFSSIEVKYFASRSELPIELNIEAPLFVYPNEKLIKGSSKLFTALLEDLHHKDLIAFVKYNGRDQKREPRLAAMLPQLEVLDDEGFQIQPAGFQLIILPFRNEVRTCPLVPPLEELSSDLVLAASNLISSIPLCKKQFMNTSLYSTSDYISSVQSQPTVPREFDYQTLEGPAMQHFYSVLQAVALSEEEYSWNQDDDMMVPDRHQMAAASDAISAFKTELALPLDSLTSALGKRGATGRTGSQSQAAKKARANDLSDDAIRTILVEIRSDSESFKVEGLKALLRQLGLPLSGKKSELVERIIDGSETILRDRLQK